MATNPVWRKTLSQWRRQVELWMGGQVAATLLFCEIFFDFRGVYGPCSLADELRAFATDAASHDHGFLRLMFGLQAEHRAGIGLFGRLLTERTPDGRRGEVDLKLHGTLPLAEGLRLLAMASGIGLTGTLARLDALQAAAVSSRDDADHLRAAFSLLTGLQLRQQISDYRAGTPVGSFVDPKIPDRARTRPPETEPERHQRLPRTDPGRLNRLAALGSRPGSCCADIIAALYLGP